MSVDGEFDRITSYSLGLHRRQLHLGALCHHLRPRRLSSRRIQLGSRNPRRTLRKWHQAKHLRGQFCMDDSLRLQPLVAPTIHGMATAHAPRRQGWLEHHVRAGNLVSRPP